MRVELNLNKNHVEDKIIIQCSSKTKEIEQLKNEIENLLIKEKQMIFYDQFREVLINIEDILFFETELGVVYVHTKEKVYRVKQKLYELEKKLPNWFTRISKSSILNVKQVISIERKLPSYNLVHFYNSHKQVFISRFYYKKFKYILKERKTI